MIPGESDIAYRIDQYINENRSFYLYRLPGENDLVIGEQTQGTFSLLKNIKELNGKSSFILSPFHVSEKHLITLILADKTDCIPFHGHKQAGETAYPLQTKTEIDTTYKDSFFTFKEALKDGKLDKLVLSRSVSYKRQNHSIAATFLSACSRYPTSYVYLFHTPYTGTWIGSTPEILLSGQNDKWHTMAIAGTMPYSESTPIIWDDKNRKEQQIVCSFIRSSLSSIGITLTESKTSTIRAGEIAHLKTDFQFSYSGKTELGNLLNLLHPTPAVCGYPKEDAYDFIIRNEGYDRRYYSGFVGLIAPGGKTDLYVNLRCAEINNNNITLYAGGGILPSSTIEKEWQETEDKLQTIYRCF